jgi:hypothetical protein
MKELKDYIVTTQVLAGWYWLGTIVLLSVWGAVLYSVR